MPAAVNLTGHAFGRLVVLAVFADGQGVGGRRLWLCRCECGREETHSATALRSGRVQACASCGFRRARAVVERVCRVCGGTFRGDVKASLCSADCRRARRRGVEAGVEHLPPPQTACSVCGVLFAAARNRKACSPECRAVAKRRAWNSHYRRKAAEPGRLDAVNARRRERAAEDPAVAEARKRQWRAKHERHRMLMVSDPVYAERHREAANGRYQARAAEIRDRRRKRLDSLGPAEIAAWLARVREQGRKYREKWRESLRANPEKHRRYIDLMAEYRRRRSATTIGRQLRDVVSHLESRLNDVDGIDAPAGGA